MAKKLTIYGYRQGKEKKVDLLNDFEDFEGLDEIYFDNNKKLSELLET